MRWPGASMFEVGGIRQAASSLARLSRTMLDLVLPPHCPTCDRVVEEVDTFCPPCFGRLRFIVDPCCRACALPFASASEAPPSRICAACLESPPPWDAARAALMHDDGARRLVLPLKYNDRTEHARVLGRWMARAAGPMLDDDAVVLVPVPLHRSRLRSRRYNQSALLAGAIRRARGRGAPPLMVDGLRRIRATRALARQARAARAGEIAGAIEVNPARAAALAGRRVVLIDDVLTTGATARACADALLVAGARSVSLLVASRAGRPC